MKNHTYSFIVIGAFLIFSYSLAMRNEESLVGEQASFSPKATNPEELTPRQWGMVGLSGITSVLGISAALIFNESDLAVTGYAAVCAGSTASTIGWLSATLYNLYIDYQSKKSAQLRKDSCV